MSIFYHSDTEVSLAKSFKLIAVSFAALVIYKAGKFAMIDEVLKELGLNKGEKE